jgi:predicted flap endonuclease-1-like 5' DNA nuclease
MQFDMLFLHAVLDCPNCLWKVLGMLLAAILLGLLLGYLLWYRYRKLAAQYEKERDDYHARFTQLEQDFASLKYKADELEKDTSGLRVSLNKCEADKATLAAQLERHKGGEGTKDSGGKMSLGAAVPVGSMELGRSDDPTFIGNILKTDNLQVIEGVGPKIESVLKAGGKKNWSDVASSNEEELRTILTDANPNYRIHNPSTWPRQAQLADEGKWNELIEYQKFLDGGNEQKGDFASPSKAEKLYLKAIGFASIKEDDLKVVEGIGPKIEELLQAAGISTWQALADANPDDIQKVLDDAGSSFNLARPKTWPKQAALAARGAWAELKKLQDELNGGRE